MRGTINTARPRYGSGGWLKNNWGEALTFLGGAALTATGVGAGAGVGLMAKGGAGMIGNAMAPGTPEAPTLDNSWAVQNRNFNMNRMRSPYSIYQTGGRLPKMRPEPQGVSQAPGGHLEQEASNIHSAHGRSHEQGGIQLPGGEIEGDEVLVDSPITGDTQVHSDELGYADMTKQLAQQKEQLEGQLEQKIQKIDTLQKEQERVGSESVGEDTLNRNKAKRESEKIAQYMNKEEQELMALQHQILAIDQQIEQLFQQQEAEAAMMGMRDEQGMPAEGMEQEFALGGVLEEAIPYIPNIAGAFHNKQLMNVQIPEATRTPIPTMSADVPISGHLQDIDSNVATQRNIAHQVPGQIGRSHMAAVGAEGVRQKGQIRDSATAMETQIRSQNQQLAAGLEGDYARRQDHVNQMRAQQEIAGITRTSANIASTIDKFIAIDNQYKANEHDLARLEVMMKPYESTSIYADLMRLFKEGNWKAAKELITNHEEE